MTESPASRGVFASLGREWAHGGAHGRVMGEVGVSIAFRRAQYGPPLARGEAPFGAGRAAVPPLPSAAQAASSRDTGTARRRADASAIPRNAQRWLVARARR